MGAASYAKLAELMGEADTNETTLDRVKEVYALITEHVFRQAGQGGKW
jgi:hypothetical protein